jgi:hypothetical protein
VEPVVWRSQAEHKQAERQELLEQQQGAQQGAQQGVQQGVQQGARASAVGTAKRVVGLDAKQAAGSGSGMQQAPAAAAAGQ